MRIYATFTRRDDGLQPEERLLLAVYRRAVADLHNPHNSYHRYTASQFVQDFTDTLLHSSPGFGYDGSRESELSR